MNEPNHRALHNLNSAGRDPVIEGYVECSVDWYVEHLRLGKVLDATGTQSLIDVGSDTGFAAARLATALPELHVIALEPFVSEHPPLYPLIYMPVRTWCAEHIREDHTQQVINHVFMNHVLEHLDDPIHTLSDLYILGMRTAFIAVPDAGVAAEEFVAADGHLHTFTDTWFTRILPRVLPVVRHVQTSMCFRNDWVESWNYFEFGEHP